MRKNMNVSDTIRYVALIVDVAVFALFYIKFVA